MRCLSSAEIEDFILRWPMPAEHTEAVAQHIDSCSHCSLLYDAVLMEQARMAEALFAEELSASFTGEVMAKLDAVKPGIAMPGETESVATLQGIAIPDTSLPAPAASDAAFAEKAVPRMEVPDAVRAGMAVPEMGKRDTTQPDSAMLGTPRQDASVPEMGKRDTTQLDSAMLGMPRQDASVMEMGKRDTMQPDSVMLGKPRQDASVPEMGKRGTTQPDLAMLDTVRHASQMPGTITPAASLPDTAVPPEACRPHKPLRRWKRAVVAASVLLVAGAFAAYSSPTLADLVRSLFSRDTVDYGMLKAQELGLVSHPNVTVKDKGYTIRINEAVADPARVVMALQLSGPDGKNLHDRLSFGEPNRIVVKDDQGREIGRLHDIGMTDAFYMLIGYFPEPTSADHITVEGTIRRLGSEMHRIPYVEGNWSFSFEIDLRQAKAQTKVIPLQGEYMTPDGMTVRLKRLIRTVQGVRLELDTELDDRALARSPGELWKKQGLRFHFEDASGEEIHSVNSRKSPHKDSLMSSTKTADARRGLMHMSYTFRYLPPGENYKFVLDGYFVAENSGASLDFNPAALRERPAAFRDSGDELRLTGFEIAPNPDPRIKDVEGVLRVQGEFVNEFSNDEWVVRDPQGNEYAIQMRGASSMSETIVLQNETAGKDYAFRIPGLRAMPERLTLVRKVIDRTYSNVDWYAEIREKE